MPRDVFRYAFPAAPMDAVGDSLSLAVMAAEALHGGARVRLDVGHLFDPAGRRCAIDASTPAGRDVNALFAGFLARAFGPDSFTVEPAAPAS